MVVTNVVSYLVLEPRPLQKSERGSGRQSKYVVVGTAWERGYKINMVYILYNCVCMCMCVWRGGMSK